MIFKRGKQGFPFFDLRENNAGELLTTVRGEMEGFISREISEAKQAHGMLYGTGNSSPAQFEAMVRKQNLCNSPDNLSNSLSNAAKIYSSHTDLANTRGKTVKKGGAHRF